jgi:hypothetical protein
LHGEDNRAAGIKAKISDFTIERCSPGETYGFDKVPCSCLVGSYNLRSDYPASWLIDASRVNFHRE